jgi:hypothetical protein
MTRLMGAPRGSDFLGHQRPAGAIAEGSRWQVAPSGWSDLSRAGRAACYGALAAGLVLRLVQLLANPSLSQDEAMLAINVVDRPFSGLGHRLDFLQGAPIGFLAMEKFLVNALGNNEYALRLVSFVAGSLALVLIVRLAKMVLTPAAVPLAIVLFAFSDPLIFWTSAAKPYAVDVLVAVVVLSIGVWILQRPYRVKGIAFFSIVGAIAIWFSNPSVFVLAGVSTALVGGAIVRRDWRRVVILSVASLAWVASFMAFGFTLLKNLSRLQNSACTTCFPIGSGPGSSPTLHVSALRDSLGEFRYTAGIPHFLQRGENDVGLLIFFIAIAFCIVGLRSLSARQPVIALALLAPLLFMLIAWALHKYPTLGRTQLFLIPSFVLLLSEGLTYAIGTVRRTPIRAAVAVCTVAIAVAMAAPSIGHLAHPRQFEGLKPVLNHLAMEQEPGDTVFVYYHAEYALRYYLECHCAGRDFEKAQASGLWPTRPAPGGPDAWAPALMSVPPRLIIGPYRGPDPSRYTADIDSLRGRKRVWVLVSNLTDEDRGLLLHEFKRRGTLRTAFSVGKSDHAVVGAYLYDMTRRSTQA